MSRTPPAKPARRRFVAGLGLTLALPLANPRARAALADEVPAVRELIGDAPLQKGKVRLEVPRLADNANAVSLKVSVDSPMSPTDYVKNIHLIAPNNPRPLVASLHLGPHAGKAQFATRVRVNGSQRLVAIAELSDGSRWWDGAEVEVTSTACLDGT